MAVIDKEGVYEAIEQFYEQVEDGWENTSDIEVLEQVSNIIVAGVGACATPGHLLKQYLHDHHLPVTVVEDYKLPAFANKDSLVFVVSYEDDAEETVSMYRNALKKGCNIVIIDDGGKLHELSKLNNTKHLYLKKKHHKMLSYGYLFFSMLKILDNSKIIEPQEDFVKRTLKVLKRNSFENLATEMGEKLADKTLLIYSSSNFESVARTWKTNFNNITKIPSFYNVFPSLSYNEISGFTKNQGDYYALFIKSDDEDQKIKKHISASKQLIRQQGVPVTEMAITGDCYLTKMFSALLIGDWLAYNLAIKRGVDPSKTPIIDQLKKVN